MYCDCVNIQRYKSVLKVDLYLCECQKDNMLILKPEFLTQLEFGTHRLKPPKLHLFCS